MTAVEADQLDSVEYFYDHRHRDPSCETIARAAQLGHMGIVQFLHGKDPACSTFAIDSAALGGHFEIVKWLHKQVIDTPPQPTSESDWHHRHDPNRSIDMAAENGSLELVQWLHEHRTKECTRYAMVHAASNGHMHILQ